MCDNKSNSERSLIDVIKAIVIVAITGYFVCLGWNVVVNSIGINPISFVDGITLIATISLVMHCIVNREWPYIL
jgi:hypothetical protein